MLFLEQTRGFALEDGGKNVAAPSFFELVMQERMTSSIKPAIEYLVSVLCESFPNLALLTPVRRLDESYTLLRLCIEYYFLSKYDSLVTERLYGMKRVMHMNVKRDAEPTTRSSTPRVRTFTLLLAVIVPYLKSKLDTYYKEAAEQLMTRRTTSDTGGREQQMGAFTRRLNIFQYLWTLKKGFVASYPFAHFAYEGVFFLYKLLYLFGDTPYFTPFLRLVRMKLVKVTLDDESTLQQNEAMNRKKKLNQMDGPGWINGVRRLAFRTTWTMLDHSYVLLLLGVAGYKLVEWMYLDEGVAAKLRMTGTNAPIPPPPVPPQISDQASTVITMDPTLCPLCKKTRVNPAMTPSGFVFCFVCIHRHVERHGKCPVTQEECEGAAIIKLYEDARVSS
ncbi:hypothetical protein CCR75_006361 [Bremia lactucae]|uniref:Peroxisome assembly protein 12 n=1 Tax=Bremia lactucae TaxID=4779 RepID=A0A976IM17_BRELC|nr:hypothetical protein CCR75_006361 [Bremia lactucae]